MRLPVIYPEEVVRILLKLGYEERRQTGSHLIMRNPQNRHIVPVPIHHKDLKKGLLMSMLKQSNLTLAEFVSLR